jgi:hypothetical protein
MCLYLFNKAHTGTTTSDLKISKNIMVKLNCCINVTKHIGVKYKSMEIWYSYQQGQNIFGQQLLIKK